MILQGKSADYFRATFIPPMPSPGIFVSRESLQMSVIVGEWYARIGEKRAHRLVEDATPGWRRAACGALALPAGDWLPKQPRHDACRRCAKLTSGACDSARLPARGGMSNGRVS